MVCTTIQTNVAKIQNRFVHESGNWLWVVFFSEFRVIGNKRLLFSYKDKSWMIVRSQESLKMLISFH